MPKHPESVDARLEITSEVRGLLGRPRPRLFVLGQPFRFVVAFKNDGQTEMPYKSIGWSLRVDVAWADGRYSDWSFEFDGKLAPGDSVEVEGRGTVVSSGLFSVTAYYPRYEYEKHEGGGSSSRSGDETISLGEWVAVSIVEIRQRWLLWISVATLLAVLIGLFIGLR